MPQTASCFATPQPELPSRIVQPVYKTASVWSWSSLPARGADHTLLLGKGESPTLLGPAKLGMPSPDMDALLKCFRVQSEQGNSF